MKRSNAVTARELVEFFVAAKDTPKLRHPHRSGAPDVQRQATLWGLHQFDPTAIWRALQGQSPSSEDKMHKTGAWDVTRVIRELIAIAKDDRVDDKGKPVTTANAKMQALDRIREYHALIAGCHLEFLEASGRKMPDLADSEVETDPIVLSLRRNLPGQRS